MRFYEMRNRMIKQLAVTTLVFIWYVLLLMLERRKHSLTDAAILSGLNKAQFSKFLKNNRKVCFHTLDTLSKKQAKILAPLDQKSRFSEMENRNHY